MITLLNNPFQVWKKHFITSPVVVFSRLDSTACWPPLDGHGLKAAFVCCCLQSSIFWLHQTLSLTNSSTFWGNTSWLYQWHNVFNLSEFSQNRTILLLIDLQSTLQEVALPLDIPQGTIGQAQIHKAGRHLSEIDPEFHPGCTKYHQTSRKSTTYSYKCTYRIYKLPLHFSASY